MVVGLFEDDNNYIIDFEKGSNCLFGDNGTGKTTLINLIVAGLETDLLVLMGVNFEYLSITISNDSGVDSDISISKVLKDLPDNDEGNLFDEEVRTIVYEVDKVETSFDYDLDNIEYYAGKMSRGRKFNSLRSKLRGLINLTHVPLLRMRTSPPSIDMYEHEFAMNDGEDFSSMDHSTSVLFEIERQFKLLADDYRVEDTKKLESFKSKIIQKFLIDKESLDGLNSLNIKSERFSNEESYNEELLDKLESAGLSVPKSKLESNFKLLSELGDKSRELYELRESLKESGASIDIIAEADMDLSNSVVDVLVSRALFQRFTSVIIDVENLQADRNHLWDLFGDYENIVNKFLNNKFFKLERNGEFKIFSGIRPVKLKDLSSGEKHILAILGRAALSKDKGSVFIADEPELSLHLSWQRMMLPSILELSPKSQIIVATHSPAIIPKNSNKIDLGACN